MLRGLFDRETRDGRALASALELAEELARRGESVAAGLLDGFFAEAEGYGLRSTEKTAWVDGFYLDRYLVTNRDFECMAPSHQRERNEYSHADEQPVIYVNWWEARLFCRWRGPGFRLPTEEEWEKAAAWDPVQKVSRKYPWGDEFDQNKCNTWEGGKRRTTQVGEYPDGASAFGCYDMAGNVWEWTASPWSKDDPDRMVRGGSWSVSQDYAACAFRRSSVSTMWVFVAPGHKCSYPIPFFLLPCTAPGLRGSRGRAERRKFTSVPDFLYTYR